MMTKESRKMDTLEREEMLHTISDLSKDAWGHRVRMDYAAMSDEELTDAWDGFLDELDRAERVRAVLLEEAMIDYEKEITEVIALGAGSRKRALLWMLDSVDGELPMNEFEVEHWMYNRGLLGEDKIKKELIAALKGIWNDVKWINV
jgi:hypothetical protein